MFVSLGGKPIETHPLSFVLQGSEFLKQWFGNGTVTMLTKDMLYHKVREFKGTLDDFMKKIMEQHYYIEVQLWNDDYLNDIISEES